MTTRAPSRANSGLAHSFCSKNEVSEGSFIGSALNVAVRTGALGSYAVVPRLREKALPSPDSVLSVHGCRERIRAMKVGCAKKYVRNGDYRETLSFFRRRRWSMERALILIVGLACLAPSMAVAPRPDDVVTEVRKVVHAYVDANSRADVNVMMEMVSRTAGVVSIGDGKIARGWDAIRSEANKLVGFQDRYQILLGPVDVSGLGTRHALAVAPYTITLLTEEGAKVKVRGALTLVLEKTSGAWKIMHEHSSSAVDEAGCL